MLAAGHIVGIIKRQVFGDSPKNNLTVWAHVEASWWVRWSKIMSLKIHRYTLGTGRGWSVISTNEGCLGLISWRWTGR